MPDTASIDDSDELTRTAAVALGRLRRAPGTGRSEGWVGAAMRALEERHPDTFARLRRRTGLALQVADFARLQPAERAAITLGLLFRELSDDAELSRGTPRRAWEAYLLRHEEWLAAGFAVAEHLESDRWGADDESLPCVVARIACYYDHATLELQRRPLQVLEEFLVRVQTPAEEAVASLLLSEEGQELCDRHFRRRAAGYDSPAAEIARGIVLLRKDAHAPAARRPARAAADDEAPVAPFRLSSSGARPKQRRSPTKRPEPEPVAKARAQGTNGNFERRREALRSLSASGRGARGDGRTSGPAAETIDDARPQDEERDAIDTAPARDEHATERPAAIEEAPEMEDRDTGRERESARYVDRYRPIEGVPPREETMDNVRSVSTARGERPSQADVIARLDEIQIQFERIQRAAEEGQRMLASLAPQLNELTAWMSDLESIMERWRGPHGGSEERVA